MSDTDKESCRLDITKDVAIVLFEWLARNWEAHSWEVTGIFEDSSEKTALVHLENALQKTLGGVFSETYDETVRESRLRLISEYGDQP